MTSSHLNGAQPLVLLPAERGVCAHSLGWLSRRETMPSTRMGAWFIYVERSNAT